MTNSLEEKVIGPEQEPNFGTIDDKVEPKEVKQTPITPSPITSNDKRLSSRIYTKVLTDIIKNFTLSDNDKDYIKRNIHLIKFDYDGSLTYDINYLRDRNFSQISGLLLKTKIYSNLNIPTIDVLSCYLKHGEDLVKYSSLINHKDGTPIVKDDNSGYNSKLSLDIPNYFLDKQNTEKAKIAGIRIDELINEIKDVQYNFLNESTIGIQFKMSDRFREYNPFKKL